MIFKSRSKILSGYVGTMLLSLAAAATSRAQVSEAVVDLGRPPENAISGNQVYVSRNNQIIAWMQLNGPGTQAMNSTIANESMGGNCWMVINGKPQKSYGMILAPAFSPDGRHYVYACSIKDKLLLNIDGRDWDGGLTGICDGPAFSGDSQSFLIAAKYASDEAHIVFQGKPGPAYAKITQSCLSEHGHRYAYEAERGGKHFVVLDGAEQQAFDQIIIGKGFSPDEKHFAYSGRGADGWHVVLDGRVSKPFLAVSPEGVCLSADSRHGAFIDVEKEGERAMIDGVVQPWCLVMK